MRRGTTPTHRFNMPFEIPQDADIRIVYSQCDKVLIEKITEDCDIDKSVITVTLTDQETLRFKCHKVLHDGQLKVFPAEIQIGVKTKDGAKDWSDIIAVDVERCLKEDGVI